MNISKRMIGVISTLLVLSVLCFGTVFAGAGTVEGRVQGLQCVLANKLCPVDNQDPHIAVEKNFVVVTGDNSYYLIPNLDRAVMARYLMSKVRVSGVKSAKYNAITADKFEVYKNGKWTTIWTQAMEDAESQKLTEG